MQHPVHGRPVREGDWRSCRVSVSGCRMRMRMMNEDNDDDEEPIARSYDGEISL
jgi:hypothetical protein